MQDGREGAIWKRLALALGDGVAFGVGVNLSNNAAARIAPARPELRTFAERLNGIEQRIEQARQNSTPPGSLQPDSLQPGSLQQRVVEAVVKVVDTRLREQAELLEKRVTDEIAALRSEVAQQIAATRNGAAAENRAVEDRLTERHRQFAESMSRLLDEQIAAMMELRQSPVDDRVQPIQDEVADLQRRVGENDRDTLDLVLAIGELSLRTAERLAPFAPQQVRPADSSVPVTAPPEPMEPPKTPPAKLPRHIPLVSLFFFVSGGLLLLHYL